jgi:hypothetical protein
LAARPIPTYACRLRTAARYSNLCALRPQWAGINIRTRLHRLTASRAAPVVCIQKVIDMTWVGVSGSWRYAPPGLSDAVHRKVAAALQAGKSIVTGGALGVDFWATETALDIDPARLKVILPTSLATYARSLPSAGRGESHISGAGRRPGQAVGGRGVGRRTG